MSKTDAVDGDLLCIVTGRWWRNIQQWDGGKTTTSLHPIHSRAEIMKYPRASRIQGAVGIVGMIVYL